MGIKPYNVIMESVRFRTIKTISFAIKTNRDLSTLFPAFCDSTSSGISKFSFNMGQDPFIGDTYGFLPYDTNYSSSKLLGNYTTEGTNNEVIVPDNLNTIVYDHNYNSGKYYFEINIEDEGRYGSVGLSPSSGDDFRIVEHGVGLSAIGYAVDYLTYRCKGE